MIYGGSELNDDPKDQSMFFLIYEIAQLTFFNEDLSPKPASLKFS